MVIVAVLRPFFGTQTMQPKRLDQASNTHQTQLDPDLNKIMIMIDVLRPLLCTW